MDIADTYVEHLELIFKDIDDKKKEYTIADAKENLAQLKLHVKTLPTKDKQKYNEYVQKYTVRCDNYARDELLREHKEKTKVMAGTDLQEQSLNRLKESVQKLAECHELGTNTITNLEQQGEKIASARQKVKETSASVSRGNSLLTRMSKWWR